MAISPAFSIAQRALLANESALGVTSNNIANVNTPGFTRQVPEFAADVPVPLNGVLVGTGAHIRTVRQILDPLLDRRLLASETDRRQQGALRDQLGALAGIVNDLDTPSLSSALGAFFEKRYTHPISEFSDSQQADVLDIAEWRDVGGQADTPENVPVKKLGAGGLASGGRRYSGATPVAIGSAAAANSMSIASGTRSGRIAVASVPSA